MADEEESGEAAPAKPSKLPLLLGFVLAIAAGAGGFYAGMSGLLPFGSGTEKAAMEETYDKSDKMPDVAFVPVEPLTVSLAGEGEPKHLRFRAQLEVGQAHEAEVVKLLPRVSDVLNGYLRALTVRDLEDSTALIRLRAQMLRRIEIVLGRDRVNDLLIMEFVLN